MASESRHGLNRRKWTKSAVSALIAAPAFSQVTQKQPPRGAPAPPPPPATPAERLQKAYSDVRATSDQLAKIELPPDVEPAFAFRAIL